VPFCELSAALKSFARRRQAQQVESVTPEGGLRLQQRELHGPAGSVRLTPAEEALLTAFARAPSGRLESWQLLELLGMDSAEASKTSLEVRITRLRKKLAQAGAEGHCLESIRGIGYQLHTPVQVIA
jgi:DNA-binding response OmpR family regulator